MLTYALFFHPPLCTEVGQEVEKEHMHPCFIISCFYPLETSVWPTAQNRVAISTTAKDKFTLFLVKIY